MPTANRGPLESLAQALLKSESLNEKEFWDVTGLTEPPGQVQVEIPSRAGKEEIAAPLNAHASACATNGDHGCLLAARVTRAGGGRHDDAHALRR